MNRETKLSIFAIAAAALLVLELGALAQAQTPAPTADQCREDASALISAVRQERDQNADALAQAMAANAKLAKDLDKTKAALKASDEALDAKDE